MNEVFIFQYQVSPDLVKRAMTSWAKSRRSFSQNMTRFLGILLIGALTGAGLVHSGIVDYIPSNMILGWLIGFYVGLALWFVMHRIQLKKLARFAIERIERHGAVNAEISANGIKQSTKDTDTTMRWTAIDQIIRMRDATVLRVGAMMHAIPHDALPAGVDADVFHQQLIKWQQGAV